MARNKDKQPNKEKPEKPEKHEEARALPTPAPVAGRKEPEQHFPVVAIGASAGGLEAFEQFFTQLPPDSGIAFVVIQHLDPHHKSILCDLLKRYTRMKVMEVEDGMLLQPDTVFVIPPNRYLAVHHGKLHLLELTNLSGPRTPIDYFFRSLASDCKEKAVCIVLSGTGSEGAMGLRAIKGEGGMAMVQDPQTAKFDGMPRNALATGLADYCLPPDKMPEHLITFFKHALLETSGHMSPSHPTQANLLEKVFLLVRSQTGHDFTYYKQNTIIRRIERRMAVNRITRLADYVRYLQEYPTEADTLFKELLIGVTSFFRDREAFEVIRQEVLPKLINRLPNQPVRIWVSGCASGEEAYSLAILCRAVMQELKKDLEIKIFATDIDASAVEYARMGLYPQSIAVDVPPPLLERFFERENSSYRVRKEIRDMVVFALQNVLSDPPFSKVDLVSCRNLLIYLGPELQAKVLPLFHYSLNPLGFLFLGASETPGELGEYFKVVNRKWKIFQRKEVALGEHFPIQIPLAATTQYSRGVQTDPAILSPPQRAVYRNVTERIILNDYGPTGVLIDEDNNILFIRGRTGKYLEPADGAFTGDILAMAREGLKLNLANAIHSAATQKVQVRCDHVAVKTNGEEQLINLLVKPVADPASLKGLLLVIFEDVAKDKAAAGKGNVRLHQPDHATEAAAQTRIIHLEQELQSNKEYLQTTVEELYSSNEELQSTNEELHTSKEELQSINEELTTVNVELQQKIEELSLVSSDLSNLLSSTEIGTIFLDTELKIKNFTPTATQCINLIDSDKGRPVSHIASNLRNYNRLVDDSKQVLRNLQTKEEEVQNNDGTWYIMRILPYRSVEHKIDGVVVTFVNISERRQLEEQLRQSHADLERRVAERTADLAEMNEKLKSEAAERCRAEQRVANVLEKVKQAQAFTESIVETVREPLVVLDEALHIIKANRSFYSTFKVKRAQTEKKFIYDLGNGQWNIPKLRKLLEEILPKKDEFNDLLVEHTFPEIGHRVMLLNARCILSRRKDQDTKLILLAMEDITGRTGDPQA